MRLHPAVKDAVAQWGQAYLNLMDRASKGKQNVEW